MSEFDMIHCLELTNVFDTFKSKLVIIEINTNF